MENEIIVARVKSLKRLRRLNQNRPSNGSIVIGGLSFVQNMTSLCGKKVFLRSSEVFYSRYPLWNILNWPSDSVVKYVLNEKMFDIIPFEELTDEDKLNIVNFKLSL